MGKSVVLTEKESVAEDFAEIFGCKRKGKYFEGDKYIITWLYGHLLKAYQPEEYDSNLKKWSLDTLPIIPQEYKEKIIDKPFIKNQYKIIKDLISRNDVDTVINGGDCGIEGEGIQIELLEYMKVTKPIKRIWFDDMTADKIKRAFEDMKDSKEYKPYYNAYLIRSRIDYLIGMNYSRAYTIKCSSSQGALSIGRVQTPVLKLIVDRDLSIKNFKSKPFYTLEADFDIFKGIYTLEDGNDRIEDEIEIKNIKEFIKGKQGVVKSVVKETKKLYAPKLMNLTSLKISLMNKTDLTEDDIEKNLQELYQKKKIISYPRTSSKHVTESISEQFTDMLDILSFGVFKPIIDSIDKDYLTTIKKDKRYVNSKKVTDHYALIPTLNENMEKEYNDLNNKEKIIFDEMVYRFLAIFFKPYEYESTDIITEVQKYKFKTKGKIEISKGWKKIYSDGEEDKTENDDCAAIENVVNEGDSVNVFNSEVKKGKTKAPGHFTRASLLQSMELYNLGTEATRKEISNTLLKRGYIIEDGKKVGASDLGIFLIDNIKIESIKDTKTTSKLEETLNDIIHNGLDYNSVYDEFVSQLKENIELLKNTDMAEVERKQKILGNCPICKEGQIVQRKGKDKVFYGCSAYKEHNCKFSISNTIKGAKLTASDIELLLTKGSTNKLKGKDNEDKAFEFYIFLKEDGTLTLKGSKTANEKLGSCPLCKEGNIVEKKGNDKVFYGCSAYKDNGCIFSISKNVKGAKLKASDVKKLLLQGSTNKIKGDEFEFKLLLKEDGKISIMKVKGE